MGCTISKQARRDRCRTPPSHLARSHSLPGSHATDHVVTVTASTIGSLKLDTDSPDTVAAAGGDGDLPSKVAMAKAWSEKVGKRISRTPTVTPPNEPEAIDALELMAGLEESSAVARFSVTTTVVDRHSFSFYPIQEPKGVLESVKSTIWSTGVTFQSPIWKAATAKIDERGGGVGIGDFDPEVLSAFRRAMEELSPQHPCLLRSPPESKTVPSSVVHTKTAGIEERAGSNKAKNSRACKASEPKKCPPGGEGKVVLYFTSLRGVRQTYEDCFLVRMVLKGYGVRVDERDVSMDKGFRSELDEMLTGVQRTGSPLPSVFANGTYIGGAEEVRRMHEDGKLKAAFSGCEMATATAGAAAGGPCEGCGDIRFVLCGRCSGSCKVFIEEEEEEEVVVEEEEEEWEDVGGGFRRCGKCNENGIVRCPVCC